jgi:hypothetical protein
MTRTLSDRSLHKSALIEAFFFISEPQSFAISSSQAPEFMIIGAGHNHLQAAAFGVEETKVGKPSGRRFGKCHLLGSLATCDNTTMGQ